MDYKLVSPPELSFVIRTEIDSIGTAGLKDSFYRIHQNKNCKKEKVHSVKLK